MQAERIVNIAKKIDQILNVTVPEDHRIKLKDSEKLEIFEQIKSMIYKRVLENYRPDQ